MRWFALASLAAACGRIGFDPLGPGGGGTGDGSVPANEIVLTITSDGTASSAAGQPVVAASVLVDRGAAEFERHATDGTGSVTVIANVPTTIHVVYDASPFGANQRYRVFSLPDVPPGSAVRLGGAPVLAQGQVTYVVPAQPGATNYELHPPTRCLLGPLAGSSLTTTINMELSQSCIGETVHAYLLATAGASSWWWLDVPSVVLETSSQTLTGTWATVPLRSFTVTNVPFSNALDAMLATSSTAGDGVYVSDLLQLTYPSGTVVVGLYGPPSADLVWLELDNSPSTQTTSTSSALLAATSTLDASALLPTYNGITLATDVSGATWSAPAGALPDFQVFDGTMGGNGGIYWTAYVDRAATSVTYPVLPADLAGADPRGTSWAAGSVSAYTLPGVAAPALYLVDSQQLAGASTQAGYASAQINTSIF